MPNWFHVMLSLANEEQHGYAIVQEVLSHCTGEAVLTPESARLKDLVRVSRAKRRAAQAEA